MLVSIAGLGDANPADLQRKYEATERNMRSKLRMRDGIKSRIYSDEQIAAVVAEMKRKDAAEPRRGFSSDFQFKPGDEPLIDAVLAEKWEAAGICVAVREADKKAA